MMATFIDELCTLYGLDRSIYFPKRDIQWSWNDMTTAHLWYGDYFISISVLWGAGGKELGISFQKKTSHTYTLKRIYILYKKIKK